MRGPENPGDGRDQRNAFHTILMKKRRQRNCGEKEERVKREKTGGWGRGKQRRERTIEEMAGASILKPADQFPGL